VTGYGFGLPEANPAITILLNKGVQCTPQLPATDGFSFPCLVTSKPTSTGELMAQVSSSGVLSAGLATFAVVVDGTLLYSSFFQWMLIVLVFWWFLFFCLRSHCYFKYNWYFN
jgi:hypothetical protein